MLAPGCAQLRISEIHALLGSKFQMRTPDFEYLVAEFDLLTSVQRAPNLLTRIQAGGPHLDFRCFSISSCRTLCYVKSGDATADESIYRFNLTSFKFGRHKDDGSGSTRHGLIVSRTKCNKLDKCRA